MGSQQTREIAHDDLSTISVDNAKFPNDICLVVFSFINSKDEFYNFVKSYAIVCRQWRVIIQKYLGLRARFFGSSTKELKATIANGCLKYFYLESVCLNNASMKGGDVSVICGGINACRLKELNINYNQFDDKSCSTIASSLSSLEILRARSNNIKDKGLSVLSQSETMKHLRVLDIYANTSLTVDGVLALCSSQFLNNLVDLNVGYTSIGTEATHAIVKAFKLKRLQLYGGNIKTEGLIAIVTSPNMANLELLNVQYNNITSEGAVALAKSEYMKNLTKLDISSNEIGNDAGCELLSSENMKHVKSLKLGSCNIGESAIRALALNPYAKNLTSLGLNNNAIGSDGMSALAHSENVSHVRRLNLHANKPAIGDAGLMAIGSSHNFSNLENLKIGLNNIGDYGLSAFTFGNLSLRKLDLSYNDFTDAGSTLLKSCVFLKVTDIKTFDCKNLSSYQPIVCH